MQMQTQKNLHQEFSVRTAHMSRAYIFVIVYISRRSTVVVCLHNTAQNSSDNLILQTLQLRRTQLLTNMPAYIFLFTRVA